MMAMMQDDDTAASPSLEAADASTGDASISGGASQVGMAIGVADGADVGIADGITVGIDVDGTAVGLLVGAPIVGLPVGAPLGCAVGP